MCSVGFVRHDAPVQEAIPNMIPSAVVPEKRSSWSPRAERKRNNRELYARNVAKVRELEAKLLATKVPAEPDKKVLDALVLFQEKLYRQSVAKALDDSAIQDTVKRLKLLAACAQPIQNCADVQALSDAISAVEPLIHGLRKQASKSEASSAEVDLDLVKAAEELSKAKT